MPILPSTFRPPFLLSEGHLQTILPTLLRRVAGVRYRRQRIATPDDDFLDLDWSEVGARRLVIVQHGLEGNSSRPYVLGMVRAFNAAGWDALAWNFRGCSGQLNSQLRFYHSGATDDLHTVIAHVVAAESYHQIGLVGFSLGGNVTLKYLGEQGKNAFAEIVGAATFSVPCDLAGSAARLAEPANRIYMKRFIDSLRQKVLQKMKAMPGKLEDHGLRQMRTFAEFDDRYTAPLHGFRDADEYWSRCSSRQFIPQIQLPTLLVNAANDPFLSSSCFPIPEATASTFVSLEVPESGGHVGFMGLGRTYWSERRAVEFLGSLAS
ncbi:MAG: alpha/beta fold hydrolase [Chlorobi bacterium]|nr:MAG: putative hydrolase [Chlorobi bacterium OLB7]MBK8911573.1 alpha/beta fold hydrolase [Chlorobiota bacterium]MBX7215731.1 alpha/beta fold hydrolase [Candidatus Kapabacteria bacterium]